MNQVQFLRERLTELPASPNDAQVNSLVATYLAAKDQIAELVDVQAHAKLSLRRIIEETGIHDWTVASGTVLTPADAAIVVYNAASLDKLAAASAVFRRKVFPFRTESFRAGGIRIVAW